jgi:uncharacterized protein
VQDLRTAREFYVHTLGCQAARTRDDFIDVWFYGLQLTLQDRPHEAVQPASEGSRHFGVTLGREEFNELVARLEANAVPSIVPLTTDNEGLPTEQTKLKIADPSGNVIEIKTYRDVHAALEISSHSYPETVARGN